jgi:uncharacterized membrane protein
VEISKVFGVPAHPLFVHIPVVCIPLAAIGAVLLAIRPGWRRHYGPLVVALAAIGAIGAQLATGSGETLQETVGPRNLGDHAEMGEAARTVAFVLFALVVALYAFERLRDRGKLARLPSWAGPALAVLTVAGAVGATWTVTLAGHSGAKRVWEDRSEQTRGDGLGRAR